MTRTMKEIAISNELIECTIAKISHMVDDVLKMPEAVSAENCRSIMLHLNSVIAILKNHIGPLKCFNCGKVVLDETFCWGCKKRICEDCDVIPQMGSDHLAEDHVDAR